MNNSTTKSLSWIIALIGVWEVISPFVLGFGGLTGAMVDAVIVGALLIIFGVAAALTSSAGAASTLNWLNAILGIWLIIVPFVLAFAASTAAGYISSIIVGIVTLILGIWAAVAALGSGRAHETMTGRQGQMGTIPVTGSKMDSDDGSLRSAIMDRLNQDPRVDASGIDVNVNHGEVTLRGAVPSSEDRMAAEEDTRKIAGVRNVKDDLRAG